MLMEWVNSLIQIGTHMMECGAMIRPAAMEYIHIQMVSTMKANGKMIYSMVLEKKFGMMEMFMKVNI